MLGPGGGRSFAACGSAAWTSNSRWEKLAPPPALDKQPAPELSLISWTGSSADFFRFCSPEQSERPRDEACVFTQLRRSQLDSVPPPAPPSRTKSPPGFRPSRQGAFWWRTFFFLRFFPDFFWSCGSERSLGNPPPHTQMLALAASSGG